MAEGRHIAQSKCLQSKKNHMTSGMVFARRHVGESETKWGKVLRSDEPQDVLLTIHLSMHKETYKFNKPCSSFLSTKDCVSE